MYTQKSYHALFIQALFLSLLFQHCNQANGVLEMQPTQEDVNALNDAAVHGNLAIIKDLVETKGVDPNTKGSKGETALHRAAQRGHLEVVKYLVEKGVDPNIKNNDGDDALYEAALNGCPEVVKYLLDQKGADINTQDLEITEYLITGCDNYSYLEIVKYLIEEKGIDPKPYNTQGTTVLHNAAYYGHLEAVKYLVEEKGVNPNTRDRGGITALHQAARRAEPHIVEYLIDQKGLNPNTEDTNGYTTLQHAAEGMPYTLETGTENALIDLVVYLLEAVGVPTQQLSHDSFNDWGNISLYAQFVELADKLFDEEQCQQLRQQPIQAITDENRVRNLLYGEKNPWEILEHDFGTAFVNRFKHRMRREGIPEAMWLKPESYFQGLKLPDSFKKDLQAFSEEINNGRASFIMHTSGIVALLEGISPTPFNAILYPPTHLRPYDPKDPIQKKTVDFYRQQYPELAGFIGNKTNEEEQQEACERALCQCLKDYLEKLGRQVDSLEAVNYGDKGQLIEQIQEMLTNTNIVCPTQCKKQLKQLSEVLLTPDVPKAVAELTHSRQEITALLPETEMDGETGAIKALRKALQSIETTLSNLGAYATVPTEEKPLQPSSQPTRKRQKTS